MSGLDIGYVASALILVGVLAGWGWRVAKWLIDIKNAGVLTNEHLSKLNGRTEKNATELHRLETESREQFAWLKGRLGEPLEQRKL